MSSVAFDKIVPFGQNFVLDDMPFALTLKEWVTLCLCLIDSSVDRCGYSKSCFGSCPGCQFTCLFNGCCVTARIMTWSRKAEKRTGRADTPGHMPTSAARAISRTNQTNSTSLLCLIRTVVLSGAANDVFTRRRTFPWIAKVAFRRFALVSKHAVNIAKRIHTTKDFSKKCVMGTPCLPKISLNWVYSATPNRPFRNT